MHKPEYAPTAIESQAFDVSAHEVWAYRLDFAHLPDYNPDVSGVERIADGTGDGGVNGAGARYRFTLKILTAPNPSPLSCGRSKRLIRRW